MAKMSKMTATANAQAAKKAQLDKDIREFMEVNEQRRALAKREAVLKGRIEANYVLDASVKELLMGAEMYAEKVPSKRNVTWDYEAVATLVLAAQQAGALVTVDQVATQRVVTDVNTKPLEQLVKDGLVPQEAVDKCFTCQYTFSSKFGALADRADAE